jgi:murein DD-endopeptidase MepM/ murein hydrolase activator NlpD
VYPGREGHHSPESLLGRAPPKREPRGKGLKQDYFIVVLAHSLHGRLQRIHIPHRVVYGIAGALALTFLIAFSVVGSYARMAWKVSNYNALQHEAEMLRQRYETLQKKVAQTNEQMASLQVLADEVTSAYGIRKQIVGSPDLVAEAPLVPSLHDTLQEYDFLKTTNVARHGGNIFSRNDVNTLPAIWPINGRLMDGFGRRMDPFSGEGAMHTGVDISAPRGTPVHATADGIVIHATWNTGYGRCVIIDHGNNYQTWYAHLSRIDVIEGQEIRQGEVLGAVGSTGRSTGAHLHYEVRIGSSPVNPYRFLARPSSLRAAATTHEFPF